MIDQYYLHLNYYYYYFLKQLYRLYYHLGDVQLPINMIIPVLNLMQFPQIRTLTLQIRDDLSYSLVLSNQMVHRFSQHARTLLNEIAYFQTEIYTNQDQSYPMNLYYCQHYVAAQTPRNHRISQHHHCLIIYSMALYPYAVHSSHGYTLRLTHIV